MLNAFMHALTGVCYVLSGATVATVGVALLLLTGFGLEVVLFGWNKLCQGTGTLASEWNS